MPANEKVPSALVRVVFAGCPGVDTVTCAFATTAPCESTTRPDNVAFSAVARAGRLSHARNITHTNARLRTFTTPLKNEFELEACRPTRTRDKCSEGARGPT